MPTIEEFGRKLKEKYPQYQTVDDKELGMKMLEKYPEYKDRVFDTDPQTQAQIAPQEEPGGVIGAVKRGISGLKESFNKRVDNTSKAMNSDQNVGSKILQVAGQGFGTIGDVIGAGIGTTASALTPDETEKKIKSSFASGIQKVMDNETAKKTLEAYQQFQQTHPEAAGNLEAVGNILDALSNAVGVGVGTKVAKKVAMEGADIAVDAAKQGANIVKQGAAKTGQAVSKTGEYVAGQAYGLKPETVRNIIKNPEIFTEKEMAKIDRESIFTKTKTAIEKRLEGLSEAGKEYDAIKRLDTKANVSENTIIDLLKSKGISVEDGKIKVDLGSDIQMSAADAKGLEDVLELIKGKSDLTAKEVLNLRTRLSNLSKFGEGKTDASKLVAREIRKVVDTIAKKEIPGLADLDAKFAPERQLLSKIKGTIFNKDGTIKDNAVSKIATLTGKGKEQVLARMEKIVPGITEDVNILKSIEDIEYAKGQKVGAYMRTGLGVGAGAVSGGPIGAIIGAIATSPQVGVAILRAYGKAKNISGGMIDGMIKKMKSGQKLKDTEAKIMNEAVDNAAQKADSRLKNKSQK